MKVGSLPGSARSLRDGLGLAEAAAQERLLCAQSEAASPQVIASPARVDQRSPREQASSSQVFLNTTGQQGEAVAVASSARGVHTETTAWSPEGAGLGGQGFESSAQPTGTMLHIDEGCQQSPLAQSGSVSGGGPLAPGASITPASLPAQERRLAPAACGAELGGSSAASPRGAAAEAAGPLMSPASSTRATSPVPDRLLGDKGLQQASRQVQACAEAITVAHLEEILQLGRPDAVVREVVETMLMVLGYRDTKWVAALSYFGRPAVFLEKMRGFDASRSVSRLQYQKLCRGLTSSQGTFEEGYVDKVCPACGPIARWCRAVGDLLARRYGSAPEAVLRSSSGSGYRPAEPRSLVQRPAASPGPPAESEACPPLCSRSEMRPVNEDARDREAAERKREEGIPREFAAARARLQKHGLELLPDVTGLGLDVRAVRGLTVRRPNVGEVTFHGTVDLVKEHGILEELPSIIRLQPGEVVLYPDAGTRPPEGEGLNRPATITLYQCMPPNNGNFPDPESRARYRERIARMTEAKGAQFVDYDCDRGVWQFSVDHF